SARLHRPRTVARSAGPAADDPAGAETVRQAYRRMLVAARRAGRARGASETTRELQARLTAELGTNSSLGVLTNLYDTVRYGEADLDASAASNATEHADIVAGTFDLEQPISS